MESTKNMRGLGYMFKNNTCEINWNEKDLKNKFSICSQLSIVDETKTDMEYNCFGCKHNLT